MSLTVENKHYALAVLTLVYVFNFVDRQLLAILVEPIKEEFGVSDTLMGLLYGLSFALFYATLAIPVARLADRKNRRNIVAIAATLWSLFTIACGYASTFVQLLVFRTGVAIGEAGGAPPSQSMITDHYPPSQRARAMAVFSSATFIGTLVAFIGGAYVAEHYGWRWAFIVVGAPGILLAALLRFTTQEPQRGRWDSDAHSTNEIGFLNTLQAMWHTPSLKYLLIGCALASLSGYALGYWAPSFLIRVHSISISMAGAIIGIVGVTTGLVGSIVGAAICDKLAKKNRRWMLYVPALSLALSLPLMWAFLAWPESQTFNLGTYALPTAILLFTIASFLGSWWAAPSYVAVQEVVPPKNRTLACAILLFVMNVVGFGLGPLIAGALTDAFTANYGDNAIRYALIITMSPYIVAMFFYYLAGRNLNSHASESTNTQQTATT